MFLLQAKALQKSYPIDKQIVPILRNISLDIEVGEFVVIVGASGSGKTTLMSVLAGLEKPTSGEVLFNGVDLTKLNEEELSVLRTRDIGFVFQQFHLIPSLTAEENVLFPLELAKHKDGLVRARKLLARAGMSHRLHNFPVQLSGGEQQRVAICRALANSPKLLFADEPTGNLDSKSGKELLALLLELRKETGTALVLVTHDESIARVADRRITIVDGRIKEDRRK
jgi:putative ABC transport system ATP-binding protein